MFGVFVYLSRSFDPAVLVLHSTESQTALTTRPEQIPRIVLPRTGLHCCGHSWPQWLRAPARPFLWGVLPYSIRYTLRKLFSVLATLLHARTPCIRNKTTDTLGLELAQRCCWFAHLHRASYLICAFTPALCAKICKEQCTI